MATGNQFTTAQASPTMQLLAPDIAAQQLQLARQQQIASMLREQALTPMGDTQVINGWAIKKSPLEGLAKIAQALGANYSQSSIDDKNLELAKTYQGRLASLLGGGGMTPEDASTSALTLGAKASPSQPDATGELVNQGGVGPTNANAAVMDKLQTPAQPQGSPSQNNFNIANLLRGQAIESLGGQNAGSAYWKQYEPTEATKLAIAAGVDPSQANRDTLTKNNFIAPVNARPGSILRDPRTNLPLAYNPHIPEGASPTFDASGNVIGMNPISGAADAIAAAEKAKAMGNAAATPTVVYGTSGAPMFSTKAQDVGRATGNPSAGSVTIANDPGSGAREIAAIQKSLDTPGAVTDPSSRQLLQQQIAEIKRQAAAYPQPTQGAVTPQLPPGMVANTDVAQSASAKTMHDSYTKLQSSNSSAQAALDALDKMQGLAAKKNALLTAGVLGTSQTAINPDAAEYEKQRANLIAQLSQQNGTNGSDAGRALTAGSVPDFGKPKSAIADGLGTLKNQTVAQQIKINFLTPHFQSGDSKKYTTLENQFDQNISPSMVPLLTAQPGPARAAQLQAAAKDPAMRAKLNWAAENGLLK